MSETTVAVIEKVTSKEGATNGKAWRKFSVKTEDGTFFSTFDKAVAEAAHNLAGQRAEIFWKPSGDQGQFKDILGAKAAANGAPTTDTIPTEKTPEGDADWSVIGLRKTRCLLWANYLMSPLAAQIAAQDKGAQPLDARVFAVGRSLVTMAEADVYHRAPANESDTVPF